MLKDKQGRRLHSKQHKSEEPLKVKRTQQIMLDPPLLEPPQPGQVLLQLRRKRLSMATWTLQ